jgi:hypothetical protein
VLDAVERGGRPTVSGAPSGTPFSRATSAVMQSRRRDTRRCSRSASRRSPGD